MKVILQTNKEVLCGECKNWMYVASRSNDDHTICFVCRSEGCINKGKLIKIELSIETMEIQEFTAVEI